jgi:glycosyltransferase involved in cell wall biosynthesis
LERAIIIRTKLDSLSYVARIRHVKKVEVTFVPFDTARFNFAVVLPDYGVGGWNGFVNFLKLLWSRSIRIKLTEAVRTSSFIFAEAPSFEAWLVSRIAWGMRKRLNLEINTESTLDFRYMWQRFGLMGFIMIPMISMSFKYVRMRSVAALYMNKALLDKYPISDLNNVAICSPSLSKEWYLLSRRSFSSPASKFLYVGNLEKVKQIDFILKAFHLKRKFLHSGWKFELIGDGPERLSLEKLVGRLGLESHVVFRGRVKHGKNLRSIFMDNDMLLISSFSETGPRVLLEALALGLPVLSTKVGLAQELLSSDCLAEIGDLRGYANKLLHLSFDQKLLSIISETNCEKAKLFSEEILSKKENDFFERVINKLNG